MAFQVFRRDQPSRALALVSPSHALIFQPSRARPVQIGHINSMPPQSMLRFAPLDHIDLSGYRSVVNPKLYNSTAWTGILGLINIDADVFLCVITRASPVANVRRSERVLRIETVEFYCINRADFDDFSVDESAYDVEQVHQYDARDPVVEHPCLALKKLLSDRTFYYSVDFDLTNRMQDRALEESFNMDRLDYGFLWNSYMMQPLIDFRSRLGPMERKALDDLRILIPAIRGHVSMMTIPPEISPVRAQRSRLPSALSLVSRLSCLRAGTRFNSRGIDDDGNVANFVETETVYWHSSGLCFSYAQIRGSVPVFWEQAATGLLPQQQKIHITRPPEATQPAFDKHFKALELKYGSVHVLNLLSANKLGEMELASRYSAHLQNYSLNQNLQYDGSAQHSLLQQTQYDFNAETREIGYEAARNVRFLIQDQVEGFVYFLADSVQTPNTKSNDPEPPIVAVLQQGGVFRTNCLDCLDRTNLVQTMISQMALECIFTHREEKASSEFWMRHSTVWADNGDALSKIYAGTGALKSSFTRHGKMSIAGALADARKSATRLYMNNFMDKGRQAIIDTLLGRLVQQIPVIIWDPINDFVSSELSRRIHEYCLSKTISIWAGTFNLNGKGRGIREDLSAWLCPRGNEMTELPHIVVAGFQEMVELNPQQIMSTDPARRREWELAVAKTLNEAAAKRGVEEYVLLRSGQLVGAALVVFVRSSALAYIRNVEGMVKKTGLNGIAGNKGGVGIRMDYANTSICFVTAHLAAGFANYDERNRDYQTIAHGLRFSRNRSIESHDSIIWLGDFNYRIGLSDDVVRKCIDIGDLATLFQNDQLNIQMIAGHAFPFYSEAKIEFLPTYKYDNGTDLYDTSDKARIPAYCDRILSRGNNIRQVSYDAAPLKFSDHRPVYAMFHCVVKVEDEKQRDAISREIYESRRVEIEEAVANRGPGALLGEPASDNELSIPGFSTNSHKKERWWLKDGSTVTSTVAEQYQMFVPNLERPSNPFTPRTETDWVDASQTLTERETSMYRGKESRRRSKKDLLQEKSSIHRSPSTHMERKLAPPVPRKPSTLAQPQSEASTPRSSGSQNVRSSISIAPRRIDIPSSAMHTTAFANLLPTGGIQQTKHGSNSLFKANQTNVGVEDPLFTLMDDEDYGAKNIPALEPSKHHKV